MRNDLVHFRPPDCHRSLCSSVYNDASRYFRIVLDAGVEFSDCGRDARLQPRKYGSQPPLISAANVRSSLATLALAFASMAL